MGLLFESIVLVYASIVWSFRVRRITSMIRVWKKEVQSVLFSVYLHTYVTKIRPGHPGFRGCGSMILGRFFAKFLEYPLHEADTCLKLVLRTSYRRDSKCICLMCRVKIENICKLFPFSSFSSSPR